MAKSTIRVTIIMTPERVITITITTLEFQRRTWAGCTGVTTAAVLTPVAGIMGAVLMAAAGTIMEGKRVEQNQANGRCAFDMTP
jgi:hypothetical protein